MNDSSASSGMVLTYLVAFFLFNWNILSPACEGLNLEVNAQVNMINEINPIRLATDC